MSAARQLAVKNSLPHRPRITAETKAIVLSPDIRRFYAEQIRALAALPEGPATVRLLDAFAAVPREDHVGPGPWLLRSPLYGLASRRTPDDDPRHLYHNVLVALDEEQGVNIGDPSLWARLLHRAAIARGASILQVGAGSGYYTAILAALVGPGGRVVATEIDEILAGIAERALSGRANVSIRRCNGASGLDGGDGAFDLIVAFAGVTHPVPAWTDRLAPDGRLLLPMTDDNWQGAMVLFERDGEAFEGATLGPCGFFPCVGARDEAAAGRLAKLWSAPSRLTGERLRVRVRNGTVRYEMGGIEY